MKQNLLLILFVLLFAAGLAGWYYYPGWKGERDAVADIENNTLRYWIYGELLPFEDETIQMFDTLYGIEAERVAGVGISDTLRKEVDAYNSAIEAHFRDKGVDNLVQSAIDVVQRNAPATNEDIR